MIIQTFWGTIKPKNITLGLKHNTFGSGDSTLPIKQQRPYSFLGGGGTFTVLS